MNVAFFCYMNQNQTASPSLTLIFDGSRTNLGNHYNRSSGIFTAPQTRMYAFASMDSLLWCRRTVFPACCLNNIVYASSHCNANGALWYRSVSGTHLSEMRCTFEHILSVSIKAALLATASIGQRLQDGHCFRRIQLFKIIEIKTKTEIYQIFVDNLLLTIALQHSTNCN